MFYSQLTDLCQRKNIKPNTVAKAIGLSNATATKWKNGSIPNGEALIKIADYLDCSVDYLLGRADDPSSGQAASSPIGLSEGEAALIALFRNLNEEGQERLHQYADDLASSGKYIKGGQDGLLEAK